MTTTTKSPLERIYALAELARIQNDPWLAEHAEALTTTVRALLRDLAQIALNADEIALASGKSPQCDEIGGWANDIAQTAKGWEELLR